jgi:hypothetical protein
VKDESRIPYLVFTLSTGLICFIYFGVEWSLLRCRTHGCGIKLIFQRLSPSLSAEIHMVTQIFLHACAHIFYLFVLLLFGANSSSFTLKQLPHPLNFLYTFISFPHCSCIRFQSFLFGRPIVVCLPILLSCLFFTLK